MKLFPKCSMAVGSGWIGSHSCGKPAIFRNRFGGYECQEHHDLYEYVMSSPAYRKQDDECFSPGIIVKPIDGRTLLGRLQLILASLRS